METLKALGIDLVGGSGILGLKKKYGLEFEDCWSDPKTKNRTTLSKLRFLLDKSCLWTLAHQLSDR